MKEKIKSFLKKMTNFNLFLILLFCVFFGLNKGIYKDGKLNEYYKRIQKTEQQIKYSKATDVGVSVLQYAPVVLAFVSKNPLMYSTYVSAVLISAPTCLILKKIVKETRPDDINNHKSFPSGHSMLSFVGATTILLCLRRFKSRAIIGCISIILAICVAYGRVLAKRHWYIDVCFGGIFGSFITFICYKIIFNLNLKYNWFDYKKSVVDKSDI